MTDDIPKWYDCDTNMISQLGYKKNCYDIHLYRTCNNEFCMFLNFMMSLCCIWRKRIELSRQPKKRTSFYENIHTIFVHFFHSVIHFHFHITLHGNMNMNSSKWVTWVAELDCIFMFLFFHIQFTFFLSFSLGMLYKWLVCMTVLYLPFKWKEEAEHVKQKIQDEMKMWYSRLKKNVNKYEIQNKHPQKKKWKL